jgi:hypothetical protein
MLAMYPPSRNCRQISFRAMGESFVAALLDSLWMSERIRKARSGELVGKTSRSRLRTGFLPAALPQQVAPESWSSRRKGRGLQGVDQLAAASDGPASRTRFIPPLTSQTRWPSGGGKHRKASSEWLQGRRLHLDGWRPEPINRRQPRCETWPLARAWRLWANTRGEIFPIKCAPNSQPWRKTHGLQTRDRRSRKISKYRQRPNSPASNWHELCWKLVTAKVEFLSKKGLIAG